MRVRGRWPAAVAAAAVLAVTGAVRTPSASSQSPSPAAACCFTNPRHTGVCEVQPHEGETCGSILAYLNDTQAVGKSYCGNTTVRRGWEQATCGAPAPSPSPGSAAH
jgi:hypothetical protein